MRNITFYCLTALLILSITSASLPGVNDNGIITSTSTNLTSRTKYVVPGTDVAVEIYMGGVIKDPRRVLAFFLEQRHECDLRVRNMGHDFAIGLYGRDPLVFSRVLTGAGATTRERILFFATSPKARPRTLTWGILADACQGMHNVLRDAEQSRVPVNTEIKKLGFDESVGSITFTWEILDPGADQNVTFDVA